MDDAPLSSLRAALEREIASYVYTHDERCVGNPMSPDWVAAQLAEMRDALVAPAWRFVCIDDLFEPAGGPALPQLRQCVLVADDRKGHQLYYDPVLRDYALAYTGDPPKTFLRGDAVGSFMAR